MSETRPAYATVAVANVLETLTDWEIQLVMKVRRLRAEKKRAILEIHGAVILVYRCEPAGLIAAEIESAA
jgi:hypothetical protein